MKLFFLSILIFISLSTNGQNFYKIPLCDTLYNIEYSLGSKIKDSKKSQNCTCKIQNDSLITLYDVKKDVIIQYRVFYNNYQLRESKYRKSSNNIMKVKSEFFYNNGILADSHKGKYNTEKDLVLKSNHKEFYPNGKIRTSENEKKTLYTYSNGNKLYRAKSLKNDNFKDIDYYPNGKIKEKSNSKRNVTKKYLENGSKDILVKKDDTIRFSKIIDPKISFGKYKTEGDHLSDLSYLELNYDSTFFFHYIEACTNQHTFQGNGTYMFKHDTLCLIFEKDTNLLSYIKDSSQTKYPPTISFQCLDYYSKKAVPFVNFVFYENNIQKSNKSTDELGKVNFSEINADEIMVFGYGYRKFQFTNNFNNEFDYNITILLNSPISPPDILKKRIRNITNEYFDLEDLRFYKVKNENSQ